MAYYLARIGPDNPLSATYGYNDHLADMLSRGGVDLLEREMPDEWIDNLAIAGDPDEVIAKIGEFTRAGATSVVLVPPVEQTGSQLDLIAKLILPRL